MHSIVQGAMFIADVMQQGGGVVSKGCSLLGLYSECSASVSDGVYQRWCIDESVDQIWCCFRCLPRGALVRVYTEGYT